MSLYRKTFLRQDQVTGSLAVNDSGTVTTRAAAVTGSLEDNLNVIRKTLRNILGTSADDGSSDTQGFWYTTAANGLSLVSLGTAISGTLTATNISLTGSSGLTSTFVTGSKNLLGDRLNNPPIAPMAVYDTLVLGRTVLSGSEVSVYSDVSIQASDAAGNQPLSFTVKDNAGQTMLYVADGVYNTTWAHTGSLAFGGVSEQNVHNTVLLVSGTKTGTDVWTTFANNFGGGDPTKTGIIDALNQVYAGGTALIGKQTFSGVTLTAGTEFQVSASIGGTSYTFKSPADGGSPTDQVEVFFNGMLLSGSNAQNTSEGSDWYRGNDASKPYKLALAFSVNPSDVINVIFRNPTTVV